MVSIPREVAGAALIAPSYHITVKALDDKSYFSNVRAVEQAMPDLLAHQHRLPHTVFSDYIYRVRLLKLSEAAAENEDETINAARDIRNLARQRGERVPSDKEARAMACLSFYGKGIAARARNTDEYGVQKVKSFEIFCTVHKCGVQWSKDHGWYDPKIKRKR
ncbi:hypothetical protein HBI25_123340 [Parastagonospora nodorum]|nr:hypothetical protein HBI10_113860 [Parastagonospora nodorum]KAH4014746.1 hypothetical protein HBI13_170180 [Parastagonospora nodorum]KAH4035173.1 hypothetical protein HBI09_096310 [Parastagonospora nodorum]KAH4222127.1 hypothetical protein HBI06_146110 [Parastagonospora nodorum]KAH4232294.1 hypothetical protein HBI05_176680 [Parastagonospora nodorum]